MNEHNDCFEEKEKNEERQSFVLTELKENGVGTLTINRPEKLNALSHVLVKDIISALHFFKKEKVRVMILKANPRRTKNKETGEKTVTWSTGHDFNELPEGGRDPLGWKDPLVCLVREIKRAPFPIIAMVEGGVFGGMCEVVFACSMVVAEEKATFAFTPAKWNVPYNMSGLATFMNDAGLHLLKEMICTAKPMKAFRFEKVGVINYVVPLCELEKKANELAEDTAKNGPLSITAMLAELNIMAGSRTISLQDHDQIQGLRRNVYDSKDYVEAKKAFFEKRAPVFKGE